MTKVVKSPKGSSVTKNVADVAEAAPDTADAARTIEQQGRAIVEGIALSLTLEHVVQRERTDPDTGAVERFEEEVDVLGYEAASLVETLVWKLTQQIEGPKDPIASKNDRGIYNPLNKFGVPQMQKDLAREAYRLERGEDVADRMNILTTRIERQVEKAAMLIALRRSIDEAATDLLERYRPMQSDAPKGGKAKPAELDDAAKAAMARAKAFLPSD